MADTVSELERIYTIPLRKAHHGTRSKRANRAIRDIRVFLTRHMKSDNIWLAGEVNEKVWERGKYTIPSRIRVRATRFADGVVEVTLPDSTSEGSIREAIAVRQEKAAETPVLAPMGMEGEEEESAEASAPVTTVTGIGPATAEKLEKIEISTVGDLAAASPAAVAEATGKDVSAAEAWIHEAQHLAGDHDHAHDGEDASDSEE